MKYTPMCSSHDFRASRAHPHVWISSTLCSHLYFSIRFRWWISSEMCLCPYQFQSWVICFKCCTLRPSVFHVQWKRNWTLVKKISARMRFSSSLKDLRSFHKVRHNCRWICYANLQWYCLCVETPPVSDRTCSKVLRRTLVVPVDVLSAVELVKDSINLVVVTVVVPDFRLKVVERLWDIQSVNERKSRDHPHVFHEIHRICCDGGLPPQQESIALSPRREFSALDQWSFPLSSSLWPVFSLFQHRYC